MKAVYFLVFGLIFLGFTGNQKEEVPNKPSAEAVYLNKIHSYKLDFIDKNSDEALVGIAQNICVDLWYGKNINGVAKLRMMDTSENSRLLFGYIVLEGTKAFCPVYKNVIDELVW